jgi:hypothetical protein
MSAEREAFEAWYMEHMGKAVGVYERTHVKEYRDGDGYADRPFLDGCWVGWCAATSAHSARDAQDAARYRWLREQDWFDGALCVLRDPKKVLTSGRGLGADCPSRDRLDAAIDALKEQQ